MDDSDVGDDMQEEAKTVMDSLAVGGTVATLAGWLPSVASLFTIIWLASQNLGV